MVYHNSSVFIIKLISCREMGSADLIDKGDEPGSLRARSPVEGSSEEARRLDWKGPVKKSISCFSCSFVSSIVDRLDLSVVGGRLHS